MGENRLMADLYAENERLKARISELESKHFVDCAQIAQYSDENAKLKELLRKAVKDITNVKCNNDTYAPGGCDICENNNNCDYSDSFKWKHEAEALALIGGSENA